ncbi:MAG: hypothetical protein ABI273_18300 [Lacunisphaera sp.]
MQAVSPEWISTPPDDIKQLGSGKEHAAEKRLGSDRLGGQRSGERPDDYRRTKGKSPRYCQRTNDPLA